MALASVIISGVKVWRPGDHYQSGKSALASNPAGELRSSIRARIRELAKVNVDVYGAIYVKTDGRRLITAFKIESPSDLEKWFYFEYTLDQSGQLSLV